MAVSLYRNYIKLCGLWPSNPARKGKCLGEFLRVCVAKEFRQGEQTSLRNPDECERFYKSLRVLASNTYARKYPRLAQSSATGLTAAECDLLIYEYLHKENVEGVDQELSLLDRLKTRFSFQFRKGSANA